MGENYCLDNWKGQIFSENNFFWGLDRPIVPLFEVGYGNVLYISGWCFHKSLKVKTLNIYLNRTLYSVSHINIVRPDIYKIFPEENSKQCGFWCAIPIKTLPESTDTNVLLEIILDNGIIKSVIIGKTSLSPQNPLNKNLDNMKKRVYNMVSKIRTSNSGLHVMICLATYNPNRGLFENQVYSIRNQTYQNWSCVINDDFSELTSYERICEVIGDDDRFLIFKNSENIGFYKNFERLLYLVPENVDFVALSDQDDYWFSNKIERLVGEFRENTTLVYSDMEIVDKNGEIISKTFWTTRKNYYNELDYLVLVNTITGAASMFRSSIINYLLPFPVSIGVSYHDHWIGCVANALGEIKYIDAPLYDYYQHGDNIIGQAAFSRKSLRDKLKFMNQLSNINKLKKSLVFYQCVFNIDGIRSIVISSNLLLRIPNMDVKKRGELKKFCSLTTSSWGLFIMIVKTVLNKKTTCDAERHLFKSYWADKIIRCKIFKKII